MATKKGNNSNEPTQLSWPLAGVMLAGVAVLPLVTMPADVGGRLLLAGAAVVAFPLAAMKFALAR